MAELKINFPASSTDTRRFNNEIREILESSSAENVKHGKGRSMGLQIYYWSASFESETTAQDVARRVFAANESYVYDRQRNDACCLLWIDGQKIENPFKELEELEELESEDE